MTMSIIARRLMATATMAVILLLALPLAAAEVAEVAEVELSLGTLLMQKVVPIAVEALAVLLMVLLAFWRLRASKLIAAATDNQLLRTAMAFASDLVAAVVTRAQATAVDELKAALADGKISDEEYRAALSKTKQGVLDEVLAQTLGRFRAAGVGASEARRIIDAKIEAEIPKAKASVLASKPTLAFSSAVTSAGPQ